MYWYLWHIGVGQNEFNLSIPIRDISSVDISNEEDSSSESSKEDEITVNTTLTYKKHTNSINASDELQCNRLRMQIIYTYYNECRYYGYTKQIIFDIFGINVGDIVMRYCFNLKH